MDKQIEEMAKILLETSCKGSECENCAFVKSVKEAEETCVCLKALYNSGYRKIPENAIVVSRAEYNDLKGLEKHFDDFLIKEIVGTRKETAEKFAEYVKMAFYYEFDELIPSIMADKIDEICKEITGEN